MYCVYLLRKKKNKRLYIGYTGDLKRRLQEHNRDIGPFDLLYYEAYPDSTTARTREKALKAHGSGWWWLKKRLSLLS